MSNEREEFDRTRKRLFALADRMGMKLTVIVRRKPASAPKSGASAFAKPTADKTAGAPAETVTSHNREPGEE